MMTTMNDSMMPIQGANVMTADRERLGSVKEIVGECFKVDAPMAPDYWLASDTIATINGENIMLRYRREEIDDLKIDMPDNHTGIHRHAA
jgi:hypothetical protein